jgi:long-chain acyl-CoA synthetase
MSTQQRPPSARELLGPGGAYELVEAEINGVRLPTLKNAPLHLREYYQASLESADATFYVFEDERYTFADAWRQAERVASALCELGVKPATTLNGSGRTWASLRWAR